MTQLFVNKLDFGAGEISTTTNGDSIDFSSDVSINTKFSTLETLPSNAYVTRGHLNTKIDSILKMIEAVEQTDSTLYQTLQSLQSSINNSDVSITQIQSQATSLLGNYQTLESNYNNAPTSVITYSKIGNEIALAAGANTFMKVYHFN